MSSGAATQTNDVGRIFVVGCPRSGTTLVQSLLASHSKIISFTESHLFDKGIRSVGGFSVVRHEQLREYALKFISENENLPEKAQSTLLGCDYGGARYVAGQIVASLDEAGRACGASYWVEKTPDNVFRISLIRSVAPRARFVHVIRRANEVLPSLYLASRQWGRHKSWFSCAVHWTAAVWKSSFYARGATHFVIAYEDLVQNREAIAKALFAWLGLEWEEKILRDFPETAARVIAPGETWKSANLQASPPPSASLRAPFYTRAITCLGPYEELRRRSRGRRAKA